MDNTHVMVREGEGSARGVVREESPLEDCGVQSSGRRVQGSGFRVQGSGFRFQGAGFEIQGAGGRCIVGRIASALHLRISIQRLEVLPLMSIQRLEGSGSRVQGSGFRVQGSGCRVQGAGIRD